MSEQAHFTAWLVNVPSCLDQPNIDLTVLPDEPVYGIDDEGNEVINWASSGETVFYAVTSVNAATGEVSDAITGARVLLREAGWETVGEWDVVDNAYVITVERAELATV